MYSFFYCYFLILVYDSYLVNYTFDSGLWFKFGTRVLKGWRYLRVKYILFLFLFFDQVPIVMRCQWKLNPSFLLYCCDECLLHFRHNQVQWLLFRVLHLLNVVAMYVMLYLMYLDCSWNRICQTTTICWCISTSSTSIACSIFRIRFNLIDVPCTHRRQQSSVLLLERSRH